MRKHSKLAALLALTVGTSLCIGCNDKFDGLGGGDNPPSEPTAIELETQANAVYKEKIAKWTEYVSYSEPEDVKKLNKTLLDNNQEDSDRELNFRTANGLYSKVEASITREDIGLLDNVITSRAYNYDIYSAKLDKVIYESSGFAPAFGSDYRALNSEYLKSDERVETLNIDFANGIFEIISTSYQLKEDEFLDEDLSTNYEAIVTYSYYDKAGTALAEDLAERAIIRLASGYQLIDIGESTYALANGEIIKKFPLHQEVAIPLYTNASTTPIPGLNLSYDSYGYFTQGDYNYCITEEQFQSVQVSQDFSMIRVPGVTFEVTNKNYDIVVKYETTGYTVMGYAVLENGNIYVCEYDMLPADAQSFDVKMGDVKMNVYHRVIDVATANVTTLDRNYVIQKIYNEATPEINTFLNAITLSEVYGDVNLKEGHLLAQVQKFDNGSVEQDTTTVVLNANLEIVAELPNIVENQFGYVGFLDKDVILLNTKTLDDTLVHYTADVKTGDLELYFRNVASSSIKKIDGGFIYNSKVYNYDLEEIEDLSDYDSIRVNGNLVYLSKVVYEFENERKQYCYVGQMNASTGDFEITSVGNGVNSVVNDYYIRSDGDIYDAYGNSLFTSDSYYETEYDNDTSEYKYIDYTVYVSYSITTISQEEGVYLVTETSEWDETYRYGYGIESPETKDGNVYYRYYILK